MNPDGLPEATLAAVHLAPPIGGAMAAIGVVLLLLTWRRLGRAEVPTARRLLRRAATVAMAASLAAGFVGLSVADPAGRPGLYVVAWSAVMGLVLLLIGFAAADLMLSTWLIRVDRDRVAMEQGAELLASIEAERAGQTGRRPGPGPKPGGPDEPAGSPGEPSATPNGAGLEVRR